MDCNCCVEPVIDGYEIYCPICFLHVKPEDFGSYDISLLQSPGNYVKDEVYDLLGKEERGKMVKLRKLMDKRDNIVETEKYSNPVSTKWIKSCLIPSKSL